GAQPVGRWARAARHAAVRRRGPGGAQARSRCVPLCGRRPPVRRRGRTGARGGGDVLGRVAAGGGRARPAGPASPRPRGGRGGARPGGGGLGGGRGGAPPGGEEVTCVGRVVSTGVLPTRKGLRVFRAVLRDASGLLECAWPGQPFLERQIKKGQLLLATGPVRYYHGRQLVPREFVILADEGEEGPERGMVLPVYPATEGLTHRQIRSLIQQHLDALLALADDPHPQALRDAVGVPDLRSALTAVHRPATVADAELGRQRLAFDELFDQQLVQARARALA